MILDKIGQEITPGCWLCYTHGMGDSNALRIGKVIAVALVDAKGPPARITTQGVYDDWGAAPKLTSKPGVLRHPERTIVLAEHQVPEAYRALFDTASAAEGGI